MRVPASFVSFGAGVGVALLACSSISLEASAQIREPAERAPCTCPTNPSKPPGVSAKPKFAEANATSFLDENDEIAALEAIRVALTEVGDGGSYVWRRTHGRLSGVVQPTASFKDPAGRVCRHIVLSMSIGMATAKAEGIACRLANGRWQLDG
jgi:surface antigen